MTEERGLFQKIKEAGSHTIIYGLGSVLQTLTGFVLIPLYTRYYTTDTRGVGLARAQKYGVGFDAYVKWLKEESVVIAQIEHIDAINNLESIIMTEGVDGTIIGPYDLSASMGKPGRFDDADVMEAISRYEDISIKLNKPLGYHVVPPDHTQVKARIEKGYSFIAFSTDFLFLGDNCRGELGSLRNIHRSEVL